MNRFLLAGLVFVVVALIPIDSWWPEDVMMPPESIERQAEDSDSSLEMLPSHRLFRSLIYFISAISELLALCVCVPIQNLKIAIRIWNAVVPPIGSFIYRCVGAVFSS